MELIKALLLFVVGFFGVGFIGAFISLNGGSDNKPTIGDFICPKRGRKSGVERGPVSMIGTTDPWHRFECKKCGFRW